MAKRAEPIKEILEDMQETSEELTEVIETYLNSETEESEESESDEEERKPEKWILDLNIPYCKKCGLPFSVDLFGNPQCNAEEFLSKCPTLKK